MEYKILVKGPFEKIDKFEKKLNEHALRGWRVVTTFTSGYAIILGKERH